jgi:hypothetical protein
MITEQRKYPRRKTFKTGKIIYHKGLLNQPCLVRDVSAGGATLQIDQPFECPEQFLLELLNQVPRPCEVAWKKGENVGARFSQLAAAAKLPARVANWKLAWESGDNTQVAALYAADCRHRSANVSVLFPERAATGLVGTEDLRAYAENAFQKFTALSLKIVSLTETDDRSVIEYDRHSDQDGETPARVVEILEWSDDLIREGCVFHA